ncbi:hypothetical protein PENSTE_c005G08565 [Penicillium steckii]|uniref:Peptidase C14 caspase domain-containing protein n=1 Tax=Penicillium steckii TaxID=303698 RepID=A0A1V6TJT9_9EURO|nr:hypothetical protein PENSTE_c005G08565 [Penicillium steckii]
MAMRYVILIGIDAYPQDSRPLKSCVNDVEMISYRLNRDEVASQTYTLTARSEGHSAAPSSVENSMPKPTYQNLLSKFDEVINRAKANDLVYIHFSGHGTRSKPDNELSHASGDLALVLLDGEKGDQIRYLWGSTFALFLKAMVDKGLVLTVVLDCCFSASVYRDDDSEIRFLPFDKNIGRKQDTEELDYENYFSGNKSRGVSLLPNWLINPSGHAILVACGPHEVAKSLSTENERLCGALSYFLCQALDECGGLSVKHSDIYTNIRANFRASWPKQNPVLYGNRTQSFFGLPSDQPERCTIAIVEIDGGLHLQAGMAHGICMGDLFAISLVQTPKTSKEQLIGQISKIKALTSEISLLHAESRVVDATGWVATPIKQHILHKFPIQVASTLPNREMLISTLRGRNLVVQEDSSKEDNCFFQLRMNTLQHYEVIDRLGQPVYLNLSHMQQGQATDKDIADVLEHLLRYTAFKELTNVSLRAKFRESFCISIIDPSGNTLNPGQDLVVEHEKPVKFTFRLQIENIGHDVIYIFVYSLGAFWEVQNVYRGTYEALPPRNMQSGFGGIFRKKIEASFPPELIEQGQRECKDIFKVIVTSQPTAFDFLELPRIGDVLKTRSSRMVTSHRRNDSTQEWAAFNFPVRSVLR